MQQGAAEPDGLDYPLGGVQQGDLDGGQLLQQVVAHHHEVVAEGQRGGPLPALDHVAVLVQGPERAQVDLLDRPVAMNLLENDKGLGRHEHDRADPRHDIEIDDRVLGVEHLVGLERGHRGDVVLVLAQDYVLLALDYEHVRVGLV